MSQKPMRTCLAVLTGAFNLEGGIAAANRLVIHALLEANVRVTLVALSEAPTSAQKYTVFPNVRYEGFGGDKIKFSLTVWKLLLSKHYDLVFCDHVNLAAILSPLALIGRARYVVRLNGIEVFPPRPDWEGRFGLQMAKLRLAISDYTGQIVRDQFPNLSVEVCDIALGPERPLDENSEGLRLHPASLTAVNNKTCILGTQVLLHVGRMATNEQYKGQDTLIHAMPRILAEFPSVQLVLVGRGDDEPRLRTMVQALPDDVQSAIFMTGFVTNELLTQLYQQCFAFVMPSWGEGFGIVYIEAMLHGKPCLGSRIDAAQSVIRDGQTGILVDDPKNANEVAERLLGLLKQPDQAKKMGQNGKKLVEDYYVFPHFKNRFLKALGLLNENAS